MQKYNGLLVHQEIDEFGAIEIVETDGVRALHFGSDSRQSSMTINLPNELHSVYTRTMMSGLLFNETPRHVLMVGLGGGVLPKYLLYHFSDCKIKVIELRPAMVKIARRFFSLPLEPRLKIKIADGAHYIKQQSLQSPRQHDFILLDAFDHAGMADTVQGINFFSACKELLTDEGILIINLWGSNADLFQQMAWEMGTTFNWKVLFLPVRGRGNVIGIAFAEGVDKFSLQALRKKAVLLEEQYQIEIPDFVKDLKRNNASILKRVINS